MKTFLTSALCLLIWAATVSSSQAVVVFLKDSDQPPVMGFLVSQDDVSVKVNQPLPDGTLRLRESMRSEVDDILITVAPDRLAELDVGNPQAYRDYAEELREKRQDPEAREAAIRLYVIAAYLDPDKLGKSCMLGLLELASSEQERRSRAMAYLLDPEHDERVLRQPDVVRTARSQEMTRSHEARLAEAVRLLRQGRFNSARKMLERQDVLFALEQVGDMLTLKEFTEAIRRGEINPQLLSRLVNLELMLLPSSGERVSRTAAPTDESSWRQSIRRDGLDPVPPLQLESLTKFDPRLSHYRGGRWVRPD